MSSLLAADFRKALLRQPQSGPDAILASVRYSAFLRTGHIPTTNEMKAAIRVLRKFNPAQPRLPSGRPGGGEWAGPGNISGSDLVAIDADSGDGLDLPIEAALLDTCEWQLQQDVKICSKLSWQPCYAQAMERYSACITGKPIPPFPYR